MHMVLTVFIPDATITSIHSIAILQPLPPPFQGCHIRLLYELEMELITLRISLTFEQETPEYVHVNNGKYH